MKFATWNDVRLKGMEIANSGGVMIHEVGDTMIAGEVTGEHGTYDTVVYYEKGTRKIRGWWCTCAWGQWAWVRRIGPKRPLSSGGYSGLGGRQCSHAAALSYLGQLAPNRRFTD